MVVPQNSCVDPASCRSFIRQQRNKRLVDRRKPFVDMQGLRDDRSDIY
jgi:hypothetical protein